MLELKFFFFFGRNVKVNIIHSLNTRNRNSNLHSQWKYHILGKGKIGLKISLVSPIGLLISLIGTPLVNAAKLVYHCLHPLPSLDSQVFPSQFITPDYSVPQFHFIHNIRMEKIVLIRPSPLPINCFVLMP